MPQLPSKSKAPKLVNRGGAGLLVKGQTEDDGVSIEKYRKILLKKFPGAGEARVAPYLELLVVDLDTLKHDPNNARKHNDRNLKAIMHSLAAFGQKTPIVVEAGSRVVMKGNGTLEAMRALGWTRGAAGLDTMTEQEAAGYGLADNRTAELATWDLENLARMERLAEECGYGGVGWTKEELVAMLQEQRQAEQDPDKVPESPKAKDAVTKLRDLWTLGKHRLLCGDSMDSAAVAGLFGSSKKASLVVTDPPYGVYFVNNQYIGPSRMRAVPWGSIEGDQYQGKELQARTTQLIQLWDDYVDERSAYYFWSAPLAEGAAMAQGIRDAGLNIQSMIVWAKNVLVLGQADYQWKHEICWYAFKLGAKHRWYGERDKTTVWEVKRLATSAYLHPMQKPVELYETPMLHHTHEGDVVAEPFAGSGTQFIAAQKLKRVCYGMELDPVYCDVTLQRFLDFTGVDPVRHDGVTFTRVKQRTLDGSNGSANGDGPQAGNARSSRTVASPGRRNGPGRPSGR